MFISLLFQKIPGVVKVLTSFDIPQGAANDVNPPFFSKTLVEPEEVTSAISFISLNVIYFSIFTCIQGIKNSLGGRFYKIHIVQG